MDLTTVVGSGRLRTTLTASIFRVDKKLLRIMKITAILILATTLHVSATGHGQSITLSEKDAKLEKVFKEIKKQSGYTFFYADDLLHHAKKVTVNLTNAGIEEVLEMVFRDQPLTYNIIDKEEKFVVIKARASTSLIMTELGTRMTAPPIDITGRIVDEDGKPLIGATLTIKGTNTLVTTNADGYFTIKGVEENATLEVSYVGFEKKSINALSLKALRSLEMKRKNNSLDAVQVRAYGTTSQRFNLGNVTTVKAADIEKQPVQNPLLALQGRVPGLEVTQSSGLSGGYVKVRIQGQNSLQAGLDPLIVIDGVPFPSQLSITNLEGGPGGSFLQGGSPLSYVNPLDIESMSVLKDADATAIYGSRAANGAILITTKKGKAGKTEININLQQGWGKVTRTVDMLNTRQYLDMRYEAYRNDGIDWRLPNVSATSDLKLWDTTRYTDWQKTLIGGTANYTNISANVSGGTATVQYLIGATYNRQTTVFPDDFDDQRGALNMSVNGNSADKKFRIGLSTQYMYDNNRLPGVDLTNPAVLLSPNAPPLYNADGTLNWALNPAGRSTWDNPLANSQNYYFNSINRNLVSSLQIGYTVLPGLTIRNNVGYTILQSDVNTLVFLEYYRPEQRSMYQRSADRAFRTMNTWIVEPQLEYKGRLGKGKIEGLLGSTVQQSTTDVSAFAGYGHSSNFLLRTFMAASYVLPRGSDYTMFRYNALFGRVNYSWQDKYLLDLTARRDGSSRFGDKHKMHIFWSAAAGWIFSEEKWIQQHMSWLSFGKFRASYGVTGNDQIPDYLYLDLYDFGPGGIPYQNVPTLQVTYLSNPNLQWEENRKRQLGLDLGFLNDRITINASYSRNRCSNQLTGYTLPIMTGFSNVLSNLPATIQNTSWEFTLNVAAIKRKKFDWTSAINFTLPRNELISFPNIEKTSYNGVVIVGQPLGARKGDRYAGVDPNTGNYLVFDKDGNTTIRTNLEDGNEILLNLQKLYGGWQNNINYKGFQLDFLFQFVYQKGPRDLYYWNGNVKPGEPSRGVSNQPVTVLNRWQKPGDNAEIARFTTGSSVRMPHLSSDVMYNYDPSYIRLKNLSLSWQLPNSLLRNKGFQSVRLYMQGQNLLTITRYTGLDPETRGLFLPPLQLWTIGAQLNL